MEIPKVHNVGNCTIEETSGMIIGGRDTCDIAASNPKGSALTALGCDSENDSLGCAIAGEMVDKVITTREGKRTFKEIVRIGCALQMNMFRFKQNGREVLDGREGRARFPEALAACVLEKPIKDADTLDKKTKIPDDFAARQEFEKGGRVARFFRAVGILISKPHK